MNKMLYLPDEDALSWQVATDLAASHGYVGQRGEGNIPQLLVAIANGEVVLWLPDSIDAMLRVAERLESESGYPDDAFDSLAKALRDAVQRQVGDIADIETKDDGGQDFTHLSELGDKFSLDDLSPKK